MLYCCPQESFAPGPIHTIKDTSGFKKKKSSQQPLTLFYYEKI